MTRPDQARARAWESRRTWDGVVPRGPNVDNRVLERSQCFAVGDVSVVPAVEQIGHALGAHHGAGNHPVRARVRRRRQLHHTKGNHGREREEPRGAVFGSCVMSVVPAVGRFDHASRVEAFRARPGSGCDVLMVGRHRIG